MQQMLVGLVMNEAALKLPESMSVWQAGLAMTNAQSRSALVEDQQGLLVGIVTLEDINRALVVTEGDTELPLSKLKDICTTDILYAYTDEPLSEALDRMAARGLHQLPVVERSKTEVVVGLLERDRIALTCNIVTTRKALSRYLPSPLSSELVPTSTPPTF